jgi:hypothetical protein
VDDNFAALSDGGVACRAGSFSLGPVNRPGARCALTARSPTILMRHDMDTLRHLFAPRIVAAKASAAETRIPQMSIYVNH